MATDAAVVRDELASKNQTQVLWEVEASLNFLVNF